MPLNRRTHVLFVYSTIGSAAHSPTHNSSPLKGEYPSSDITSHKECITRRALNVVDERKTSLGIPSLERLTPLDSALVQ